jgi:hypothetical protein
VAVATDREYGLFIGGRQVEQASGEAPERKAVVVSTVARPINPFGL